MNKEEIIAKWAERHDKLTADYYSGQTDYSLEQFNAEHASIWAGMEKELKAAGYWTIPLRTLEDRVKILEDIHQLKQ